jgi:hypothetical protein
MKLTQKLAISYTRAKLHILAIASKKKAAEKAMDIFFTPRLRSSKKAPRIFEKAERLSFKLEGHTVRGHRWVSQDATTLPKSVLILHGFESSVKKFDQYIIAFLDKGYEVLAFDAPAHGESGGKQLNLLLYVEMIKKIVVEFGPVQFFLAHSFGGIAVMHFLESLPHDANTKVVLIAPATETVSSIDLFFKFLQLDDGVRKEFDELAYKKSGQFPAYFSIRRAMAHIKASVLWFHDEEDEITPVTDVLKVKKDRHRNIKFIFTKGLGHRRIYKDKEVMRSAIEFLG